MRITLIGSGNVATQLGSAFQRSEHSIVQVISRNEKSGIALAGKLKSDFTIDTKDATKVDCDLFLFAVKDSQIVEVAKEFKNTDKIILHTSGSIDVNVFKNKFKNYGVFYPLQTIKSNRNINFKNVPICLEASNSNTEQTLFKLAQSISENIFMLNSEQRLRVHLAAVFANNFTNHLYTLAEKILHQNHLPFELLKPLILQTANNIKDKSPSLQQTGPAVRNDKITIKKHLQLLSSDKELQKIYKLINDSIFKTHNKNLNSNP
ncbi:MAG: Rossmann-like and DUF2520 domain-containing protein [Bacteroidia bacterium]